MLSGGVLPVCWEMKAEIAGTRSGSLYLAAALARVSHSEGLVARWNVVVEVAKVRRGLGVEG